MGDFCSHSWLVELLESLVDGIGSAVVRVEHLHLSCGHRYHALCWWVCDQVNQIAVPRLSSSHTAYDFLSLFVIENVLCEDSCQAIRGRILFTDVEGVVACGRGVVWEKRESQVVGIFVFLVSFPFIIDGGVKGVVREWLSECEWRGVAVVDMNG